jgi:integral membrane protein
MADIETVTETPPAATGRDPLRGHLLRYRVFAYLTGVGLIVLTFVGIPLQVWGHNSAVAEFVGIAHGYLYMAYVVLAFVLCYKARWSLWRTLLIVAAGTIPVMSFVAERWVTRHIHDRD